jgi:hypothetical protein
MRRVLDILASLPEVLALALALAALAAAGSALLL